MFLNLFKTQNHRICYNPVLPFAVSIAEGMLIPETAEIAGPVIILRSPYQSA